MVSPICPTIWPETFFNHHHHRRRENEEGLLDEELDERRPACGRNPQGGPVQYWNWNSVPLLRLGTVLEQSGTVPGTVPGTVLIEGIIENLRVVFFN